jgi:putative inorganic carbon (hco3(-)) transporter
VKAYGAIAETVRATQDTARAVLTEPRWNLAFFAILAYLIFEYSRLHLMYPILQPLQLGKAVVVLCAVGLLISPRAPSNRRTGSWGIDLGLSAFLLASFLSVLFARSQEPAWQGFADTFQCVVTYFLLSRILISSWRLRIFLFLWLLLNLKLAQFVIRYYFTELAWGRSEGYLSVRGVGAGSTDFFGNPGDLGVAMCVAWPLAASLLFGESKKLPRLILLACFIGFLAAILFCGSRGAVVGVAATALAAWGRNPKRLGGAAMVLLIAMGTYFVLPEANKQRMASAQHWQSDETASLRVEIWKAGISMFENHPLFGVGVGNFAAAYKDEYAPYTKLHRSYWAPHSIYIQALSETGLAGSLSLLAVWLLFLRLNSRTRKHLQTLGLGNRRSFEYRLSQGLDWALVGYLVSGAFLTVLYYPHLWFLLGLSVGLHAACLQKQPEKGPVELGSKKREFALAAS